METSTMASPGTTSAQTTPRRLNTANAATQNPQAGTRFISSCNRCRKRKIKCDAGIPSCQACTDSKTNCEYRDTVLDADVPRTRIIGLEQQLQYLLSLQVQSGQQPLLNYENVLVDGVLQPDFRGRLVVSGIRLACAFCRKRKIKCDGTAPCAGCTKFGKPNECSILYEEASSQGRSYTSYLEDRISKLERDLAMPSGTANHLTHAQHQGQTAGLQNVGHFMEGDAALHLSPSQDQEMPKSLANGENGRMKDVLHELENLSQDSPAVITNQSMHLHWNFRVSLLSLAGYRDETGPFTRPLTRAIIHPLVQHYITEIHPAAPFLCLNELNQAAEKFSNGSATADEKFKILLIMSISASSMSVHPSSTAAWNALKLFSTASYAAAYDPDTVAGLELNLLVIQFATMNPSKLNVWYIAGIVMRTCSSLGLHALESKEESRDGNTQAAQDGSEHKTFENVDEWKRRLFWSAYLYDRILSLTIGRPCGFDDEAISITLPDTPQSHGQWPGLQLQRLRIYILQSRIYSALYQRSAEALQEAKEDAEPLLKQFKLDLEGWSEQSHTLNLDKILKLEYTSTKLLLYRPCKALPERNFGDLEVLQETSVHCITVCYDTVFARPKRYYSYLMLPRVYTAGLALIYASAHLLIMQNRGAYASPQRSQVAPMLCKACVCLTHLAQEHAVGQDLAQGLIKVQDQFFEWFYSGSMKEFSAPEIRDFHLHQVGTLERNTQVETTSWTKVMQKMLGDPDASLDMTDHPSLEAALNSQYSNQEDAKSSVKRSRTLRAGSQQQVQQYPTNSQQSSLLQYQNGSMIPQPAPYSQMSHYSVGNNQAQSYRYEGHDISQDFNHTMNAIAPYAHLPHQPSLQAGSQNPDLTPLQQLAATAADHTGQMRQNDSAKRKR